MWEHTLLDEAASLGNLVAVSLLHDVAKCYDLISWPELAAEARASEFPLVPLRLAFSAYGGTRRLSVGESFLRAVVATRSMGAG